MDMQPGWVKMVDGKLFGVIGEVELPDGAIPFTIEAIGPETGPPWAFVSFGPHRLQINPDGIPFRLFDAVHLVTRFAEQFPDFPNWKPILLGEPGVKWMFTRFTDGTFLADTAERTYRLCKPVK